MRAHLHTQPVAAPAADAQRSFNPISRAITRHELFPTWVSAICSTAAKLRDHHLEIEMPSPAPTHPLEPMPSYQSCSSASTPHPHNDARHPLRQDRRHPLSQSTTDAEISS